MPMDKITRRAPDAKDKTLPSNQAPSTRVSEKCGLAAMEIDATEQYDHATISGDLISFFNWAKILSATRSATSSRSASGTSV